MELQISILFKYYPKQSMNGKLRKYCDYKTMMRLLCIRLLPTSFFNYFTASLTMFPLASQLHYTQIDFAVPQKGEWSTCLYACYSLFFEFSFLRASHTCCLYILFYIIWLNDFLSSETSSTLAKIAFHFIVFLFLIILLNSFNDFFSIFYNSGIFAYFL